MDEQQAAPGCSPSARIFRADAQARRTSATAVLGRRSQALLHERQQLARPERLGKRPGGAKRTAHAQEIGIGPAGDAVGRAAGHGDDRYIRRGLAYLPNCRQALLLGHEDVAQPEIERLALELSDAVLAV